MDQSQGPTPVVADRETPLQDWAAAGRTATTAAKASGSVRATSAVAATAALVVLVIAWVLTPSTDGLGTHRQLGLPPCGWIAMADIPCPTCGMTTAFSHAAHGDLGSSFVTQPFGMVLALGSAVVVLVGFHTAFTGSMIAPFLVGRIKPRIVWLLVAGLVLAWIWKIADHRGLL